MAVGVDEKRVMPDRGWVFGGGAGRAGKGGVVLAGDCSGALVWGPGVALACERWEAARGCTGKGGSLSGDNSRQKIDKEKAADGQEEKCRVPSLKIQVWDEQVVVGVKNGDHQGIDNEISLSGWISEIGVKG